MLYDDRDAEYRWEKKRWPQRLLFLLALSLILTPLACTSSTADSKEEDGARTDETNAEAAEDEASYEVPAYTGDRSVAERLRDASLATQIQQALVHESALRVFDFEPEVEGQTVTLRGDVNTRAQWTRADRVAERVAQGRTVENAVTIGGRPASEVTEEDEDGEATEETESASHEVYHTVQAGENLWRVARQYGASVQRLRDMNDLTSDGLSVGQRLRVR